MGIVSYAQNFEDVLLNRVFGGQETGFYVDIGAYDPVIGSISKSLYDRGWSGINVEPGNTFEKLAMDRPRDVNLCMAASDKTGEVTFFDDPADPGMSRVVMEPGENISGTRIVLCDTLENIVRDHGQRRPIDLIKIDCEGAELPIVRSTNWRKCRPKLLLIEATLPWSSILSNQDWEPILLEQGYQRAYFDGINCFYVPDERADLLRHFEVPVNILDGFQRYDPKLPAAHAQAAAAEATVHELAAELARTHAEQARHLEQTTALQRELQSTQDRLETTRQRLDTLAATQNDAVAAVVQANTYQLAELRRHLVEQEIHSVSLSRERDALLGIRDEALRLRRLMRELRWPDGPSTVRIVLPLARLLRRIAGTRVPPVPPEELALLAPTNAATPIVSPVTAPTPPRRSIAKRAAWLAYRPFRPVGRPAALRLRAFLTMHIHNEFLQLDDKLNRIRDEVAHVPVRLTPQVQAIDPQVAELQTEIRQFGKLLEDTLLTIAMGSPGNFEAMAFTEPSAHQTVVPSTRPTLIQGRNDGAVPASKPAPPQSKAPTGIALRLPHGRTTDVEFQDGDLSVAAALAASGGDWEPHVRRYLTSIVQSDWVCLDVGANLGAHTLSMAVLASDGQVVAFEADADNFGLLSRNIAALAAPHAAIAPVNLALWDRPGTLVFGGADELAGCSFVAEYLDDASVEQRLRAVVDAGAIDGVALNIRRGTIAALPLDDWAEEKLTRLDLIKLDVEGAETRVIRGAAEILRRFRPILLVEYNPACAAAYFGQPPEALFEELTARFAAIHALEQDGTLTSMADWPTLQARLTAGKGWEDLVCLP